MALPIVNEYTRAKKGSCNLHFFAETTEKGGVCFEQVVLLHF
jgi:hypothetical protein